MLIRSFDQYIKESSENDRDDLTAGIAIIYNNKILLVHPTGASWQRRTYGIPKGRVKMGEDPVEGAIRELKEETGISVFPEQLEKTPYTVEIYYKDEKKARLLIYFLCKISDLNEIGLTQERVPKGQLQLEEIDWAKFISAAEAYPVITQAQLIILDRHLDLRSDS